MKNIGAIFAHPDDEVLGCGGTIAKYSLEGHKVSILILATGLTSRKNTNDLSIKALRDESIKSSKIMGANSITFENFPDNMMDTVPLLDVVKKIESFIKKKKIEIIFTHNHDDLNIDHSVVNKAVITACRPIEKKINVYACEILSSSEWNFDSDDTFKPNTFIDIGETIKKKIKAMECYKSEIRNFPHPRSIEGIKNLSKLRGSQSNLNYAEAFRLIISIFSENKVP
jgi:LmbE family N-acetylglucosaminyl deacetylase|tara:strand:- start:6078 stop:6758 length:681 start_codon:yes stop_codon:yes gene_type:complete